MSLYEIKYTLMKSIHYKITEACKENWENMTPTEKGKHCALCNKEVIDFTQMNPLEINRFFINHQGPLCGRMGSNGLNTVAINPDKTPKTQFKLPYSKAAAATLIASSVLMSSSCSSSANIDSPLSEQVISSPHKVNSNHTKKQKAKPEISGQEMIDFNGKVVDEESGVGIPNARVNFLTLSTLYSTYTNEKGEYSLEIPKDKVDDSNTIVVDYYKVPKSFVDGLQKKNEMGGWFYEEGDFVLSNEEMTQSYTIKTYRSYPILGGIGFGYGDDKTKVFVDGVESSYEEYRDMMMNSNSSCNLQEKDHFYLYGKAANALYEGKEEIQILILYYTKDVEITL